MIADDAQVGDVAAHALEQRDEHDAVGIANLRRTRRGIDLDKFVSGGEYADARTRQDADGVRPDACCDCELRGTESRRSTINDRPILIGIRRDLPAFVEFVAGEG